MIRPTIGGAWRLGRKPRASGDDPETFDDRDAADRVNPARAGMIPLDAVGHPVPDQ